MAPDHISAEPRPRRRRAVPVPAVTAAAVVAATALTACGAASPASRHAALADETSAGRAANVHPMFRREKVASDASAANRKKGVSAWAFSGVRPALAKSGASWFYTWATSPDGIRAPAGVSFVPMIWGAGAVTPAALAQVRREGHVLLGFNEPDLTSQSNMTVSQALALWPQLMATGMRLGSPAVASGGATPGGWLDQFIRGAAARHYRVSFIALHWYGADFATGAAVSQLRSYLQAVWTRYHKPIWLTEFALARFGATAVFPSPARQAAFVTAATAMLQRLPYLWRYAWFALPATSGDGSTGLFRSGAVATAAGRAFERA